MFDLERWQEIFDTIRKNKLRTFLTGLSVASGIFILVVLLGVGQGMRNGISSEFEGDAANIMYVWAGATSKEYKGMNPGRRISMKNDDYNYITAKYQDELEYKSSISRIWGGLVTYGKESGSYRVEGVWPDYQFLENETLVQGRYLNLSDHDNWEKVAVLGNKVKSDLFKNENPIGKYVQIRNINFKVVGIYSDPGGEREETRVFLPISTAQRVFNSGDTIQNLAFTLSQEESFEAALAASEKFSQEMRTYLKAKHTIAPDDESAIIINNSLENAQRFYTLMDMIKYFFWGVGICTIVAGIVGVSNIMLIIVKERTKEIGIRKAVGATRRDILQQFLIEAATLTGIGGVAGIAFGLLVGRFANVAMRLSSTPPLDLTVIAVFVSVAIGIAFGLLPARRAARLDPIEALRYE